MQPYFAFVAARKGRRDEPRQFVRRSTMVFTVTHTRHRFGGNFPLFPFSPLSVHLSTVLLWGSPVNPVKASRPKLKRLRSRPLFRSLGRPREHSFQFRLRNRGVSLRRETGLDAVALVRDRSGSRWKTVHGSRINLESDPIYERLSNPRATFRPRGMGIRFTPRFLNQLVVFPSFIHGLFFLANGS